jgi:hypothetical protein
MWKNAIKLVQTRRLTDQVSATTTTNQRHAANKGTNDQQAALRDLKIKKANQKARRVKAKGNKTYC